MYHTKLTIKIKLVSAYPPVSEIIDGKPIETQTTQPHSHTDTIGMMSDPTGAGYAPCGPTDQPRKIYMPRPRSSPIRRLSVIILRSARYRDGGQRRGRQHAIPAQKKLTGTHRPRQGLNDMTTHGETRKQHGGNRKSSRPHDKPYKTDETPETGDALATGPDVSHLSQSSPIRRWSEPPSQGPRSLKRDQTWWTHRQAATPAQPASPIDHYQRITEAWCQC